MQQCFEQGLLCLLPVLLAAVFAVLCASGIGQWCLQGMQAPTLQNVLQAVSP